MSIIANYSAILQIFKIILQKFKSAKIIYISFTLWKLYCIFKFSINTLIFDSIKYSLIPNEEIYFELIIFNYFYKFTMVNRICDSFIFCDY